MYTYARKPPTKVASKTWTRRLLDVRDQFFKDVVTEMAKILKEEGVDVRKTGGNYVEGDLDGDRVSVNISLDGGWSNMKAEFTWGRISKMVRLENPDDPRNVASQAIYKAKVI